MKVKAKLKSLEEILDNDNIGTMYSKNYLKMLLDITGKEIVFEKIDGKMMYNSCDFDDKYFEYIKPIDDIWKPALDEKYATIQSCGDIAFLHNEGFVSDDKRIKDYRIFKTQEQAFEIAKMNKLQRAMFAWRLQNDNVEVDWNNENTSKHFINFNKKTKECFLDYKSYTQSICEIYFSTRNKADECLKWLKQEGLI